MEQLSYFLGCLVYLIGFSSSEVTNLGDEYSWKQAMEECGRKGGNLPEVKLLSNSFGQINDIPHKNICIWLKATSRRADNLTDDKYPNSCCEIMFRDKTKGTAIKECVSCSTNYPYICASGKNTIYTQPVGDDLWLNAAQYCNTHAEGLPSDTNTEFINYLQNDQFMWVNGVRTLDTNPTKGDWMFPVCSCNELVHLTCPSNVWTYCVHVATTTMTTTQESRRTNGTNAIIITSSTYGASTVANESTKQTTFGLNEELSSVSVPVGDLPHKSENGVLIGGVVGAGVVLTISIIIVVVFLLRRSKENRNRNLNPQGAVNHDNVLKAKIHVNNAYDDVNGEVSYPDKHTSIQIQHLERESITYATPTNVEGYSEIIRDKNSGIITSGEQMMTVLYSKVQKRPTAGQNLHNMNQSTVGNDEYDKINFDKSYTQQAEHLGDVYDQTNVNCKHPEEYFENVYNKAEFYHKRQNIDAGDVYDKANFHGGQQDKHSDDENASPDQISEHIYDKADCHRRLQDESIGYL